MGAIRRSTMRRTLRRAWAEPEALPDAWLDALWGYFDQGTQRAVLRLHRSAGESELEAAGADLGRLAMPALVLWGAQDPWFPSALAERYRERLRGAEVWVVDGAGHWPWLERPEVAERIAEFVSG